MATFTSGCTGGDLPTTIRWQRSTDGGVSWTNEAGATSNSLMLMNVTLGDSGDQFRAVCTDSDNDEAFSNAATLTVTLASTVTKADTANPWGILNEQYTRLENLSLAQINSLPGQDPTYGPTFLDDISEPVNNPDSGPHPTQGQFRFRAAPSHFLKDDPIIAPGQPGASHLHMFWGNTCAEANSTFNTMRDSGGSTVQGFAGANRTAYWMPALVDGPLGGPGNPRNVLLPTRMRMYYKSRFAQIAENMPQGLQLLGGNIYQNGPNGMVHGFEITHPTGGGNGSRSIEAASWGFYGTGALGPSANGVIQQSQDQIPPTNPTGYAYIRCVIGFPFAIKTDDGTANGNPILSSADHKSHATDNLKAGGGQGDEIATPASHPYRIPHIQYLIDWRCPTDPAQYQAWAQNLRLASDLNADTATTLPLVNRGGSLHGDAWFFWTPLVNQAWMDGAYRLAGNRNAPNGELGAGLLPISRRLDVISATGNVLNDQTYNNTLFPTIPDPYDT